METKTIKQQANDLIGGLESLQSKVSDGATIPQELTLQINNLRRQAAKIASAAHQDSKVLDGYRNDAQNNLDQLFDTIQRFGTTKIIQDENNLHMVTLAASLFVEKGNHCLKLSSELRQFNGVNRKTTSTEDAHA